MNKFLLFALVVTFATSAYAGTLVPAAVGAEMPVYQSQSTIQYAYGQLQAQFVYKKTNIWAYEKASSEYAGTFPAGISDNAENNISIKAYPNILTTLPVLAMAMAEAELSKNLEIVYDKKAKTFGFKPIVGLYPFGRNNEGKYCFEGDFDKEVGTDSHTLRFYAILQDAKRTDKAFLVIFRWSSKKPGVQLAETLQFNTELWPTGQAEPTPEYLNALLRRAGCSGNGLIYSSLLSADNNVAKAEIVDEGARKTMSETKVSIQVIQQQVESLTSGNLSKDEFNQNVSVINGKLAELSVKLNTLSESQPNLTGSVNLLQQQCQSLALSLRTMSSSFLSTDQLQTTVDNFQGQINSLAERLNIVIKAVEDVSDYQTQTYKGLNALKEATNTNAVAIQTVDANTQKLLTKTNANSQDIAQLQADVSSLKGWAGSVGKATGSSERIQDQSQTVQGASVPKVASYNVIFKTKSGQRAGKVLIKAYSTTKKDFVYGHIEQGILQVQGDQLSSDKDSRYIYWRLSEKDAWQRTDYQVSSTTTVVEVACNGGK
jgi:hypothetical protein